MFVFRSPSPRGGTPRAVSRELPTIRPGCDALGDVAADAAVVVGEPVELEVLDEPVEPDGDAGRPVEDLGRDLGRDRIGAGVGEIEDLADLLDPCARSRRSSADSTRATRSSISSTSTCAPIWAWTCVKSEYMSSIPGYVCPRKPMRADRRPLDGARRVEPLAQGAPRPGSPSRSVPVDRPVRESRAREGARDLRDAACRAVGEPLARGHRLVVERARRLEVEDDDRRVDRLHDGQHLGRRRIRRRVDAGGARRRPAASASPAARAACGVSTRPAETTSAPIALERGPRSRAGSPRAARAGRRTAASTRRARCRRSPTRGGAAPPHVRLRLCGRRVPASSAAPQPRARTPVDVSGVRHDHARRGEDLPTTMFWSCAGIRSAVIAV